MPRLLFISICATILLSACGRTPESEPVAVVAGKTIGAEEYRTRYVDFLLATGLPDEAGRRAAYLERLVTMKLMAHDALEGGLAGESSYLFAEERTRRKLLIDAWVHRAVYDTLAVSEQDLQDMFVRVNTTVTARHLYAPTREAADTLYERLRRGASFGELAEEVFVDTALALHGGRLGSFGFDEMDPAFEEVAFTIAPGAVSRPVRTAQGYSIVQVEDRFTKPILTETEFAAQKNKMEWYVLDRKRRRARTALSMQLREEVSLSYHAPAFERLLAQITGEAERPEDASSTTPDDASSTTPGDAPSTTPGDAPSITPEDARSATPGDATSTTPGDASSITPEDASSAAPEGEELAWLDAPLVTFGPPQARRTWTVSDFRDQARFTDPRQRARVHTAEELQRFIDGLIVQEALLEAARLARVDRTPEFARALDRAMEDWAFEQAWDRLARDVSVPEDSIRAWYEAYDEPATPPSVIRARLHESMMDEALREHARVLRERYRVKMYPQLVSELHILSDAL